MKTKFLITLLLFLSTISFSQVPRCWQDSLDLNLPAGMQDTASLDSVNPCSPLKCEGLEYCHYWAIPVGGFSVYLYSNDSGYYNWRIIQDCRYILFDSCGFVPTGSFGDPYNISVLGNYPPGSVLMVCGSQPLDFRVYLKPHPTNSNFTIIYDMDTCHGPVSISGEIDEPEYEYYDLRNLFTNPKPIRKEELLPNTLYK